MQLPPSTLFFICLFGFFLITIFFIWAVVSKEGIWKERRAKNDWLFSPVRISHLFLFFHILFVKWSFSSFAYSNYRRVKRKHHHYSLSSKCLHTSFIYIRYEHSQSFCRVNQKIKLIYSGSLRTAKLLGILMRGFYLFAVVCKTSQ